MKKNSFIIRLENVEQFNMLTDEQCGKLLKAMCKYVDTQEVTTFKDPMVAFAFSFFKGQLDRDAEKYEEMCRNNANNGKKGGRPRKTERLSEKPKETERFFEKPTKTLCDSDSDSDCDPECEPDSDPVCDRDCVTRVREHTNTPHTTQSNNVKTVEDALSLAKSLGYSWTDKDAQEFLAYNIDKGRTTGWGYAAQRWEENRARHDKTSGKSSTASEQAASKYMCLVNRFKEDGDT